MELVTQNQNDNVKDDEVSDGRKLWIAVFEVRFFFILT